VNIFHNEALLKIYDQGKQVNQHVLFQFLKQQQQQQKKQSASI